MVIEDLVPIPIAMFEATNFDMHAALCCWILFYIIELDGPYIKYGTFAF